MSAIRRLVDGLYEEVVTGGLARALDLIAHERHIDAPELGDDAHVILARLLRGQIERAFADVGGTADDRLERQVRLADKLLEVLEAHQLIDSEQRIARPARELRGVFPDPAVRPRRPETPLATTTLLTLGQREPRIGHELACEILTACGYWSETKKSPQQQGVLRLNDQRRELLFVTLDKSDRDSRRRRDTATSRSAARSSTGRTEQRERRERHCTPLR